LEFNVPFQHKYGYIRDEVVAGTASGIKIIAMMDAEAVVIQTSWHPVGSSRMFLLASQALNKTRNMAEFQPLSGWPSVIPGPVSCLALDSSCLAASILPSLTWIWLMAWHWGTCGVILPPTSSYWRTSGGTVPLIR